MRRPFDVGAAKSWWWNKHPVSTVRACVAKFGPSRVQIGVFRLCSMNQLLYIIYFQTMPRGFGLVLNRLRGVVGVIWRPVGASGKRCEEVFPYLLRLLRPSCRLSSGFEASWKRLEASWKRRESVLEASWGVYMMFFPVFKKILQSVLILNRFSFVYEARLESFFIGAWSTLKKGFACQRRLSGQERKLLEHCKKQWFFNDFYTSSARRLWCEY